MRSLKPFQILFGGAAITSFIAFIILLIFSSRLEHWLYAALVSLCIGIVSYVTFYLLIKNFIAEKLRILYRSIRKGKFTNEEMPPVSMSEDPIEVAQRETNKWTQERIDEISKLKEQEIFRREFIGNVAHELKTPVFSVQGYILTLLEGGLEDPSVNRMFLERASKATERMTMILEDLDQLTKMEVNEINIELSNFDIHELIHDIFDELEMKAKKKKINLQFSRDYDPIYVKADRAKIAQVLTNIIGNSISYGNEKGNTTVRFYTMDDIVTIEVSDDGPGIEEEHLARLFERFYRVEKSRNRNEGGSGLGLAIAKKIIEAHRQTINVRSTPDVGSTFTFSLDKGKASMI